MLILGVVQVAGGYGFFNLGVQKIPARKASVLALWEMILGPLWVALFLHQYPGPMSLPASPSSWQDGTGCKRGCCLSNSPFDH